jgi:hypothetical protein
VLIVEIKSCAADFRADRKWRDYAASCDRLYFAISEQTPVNVMPTEAGLIVADPYGAEVLPPPTGCIVWPRLDTQNRIGLDTHKSASKKRAASRQPFVKFGDGD